MPQSNSPRDNGSPEMRRAYKQLGLQVGATMHEIEAAYWQFARDLRGQAAMAPYNDAYQMLVQRGKPPADDAQQTTVPPQADAEATAAERPPSKFGWVD